MEILHAILDSAVFMAFLGGGFVFASVYFLSKGLFDDLLDFSLPKSIKSNATDSSLPKSNSPNPTLSKSISSKSALPKSALPKSSKIPNSAHLADVVCLPKNVCQNLIARFAKHRHFSPLFLRFSRFLRFFICSFPRFFLALFASLVFMILSFFDFGALILPLLFPNDFLSANHLQIAIDLVDFKSHFLAQNAFGLLIFYVWIWALFAIIFVLCAFDFRFFAVLDSHNVAFFALCACKIFFYGGFDEIGIFRAYEIAQNILLGAGLPCLVLLFGKIFLQDKELLGQADIIFCAGFCGLFGFYFLCLSIFLGCVLASAVFIFAFIYAKIAPKISHKQRRAQNQSQKSAYFTRIPFIPFIALGGAISAIYFF